MKRRPYFEEVMEPPERRPYVKPTIFQCPDCPEGMILDFGKWRPMRTTAYLKFFNILPLRCPDCVKKGEPGGQVPAKRN